MTSISNTREDIRRKAIQFCDTFNTIYDLLYEDKIRCNDSNLIDLGDAWISANADTPLFKAIVQNRQDIFASDREVCALALTLGL